MSRLLPPKERHTWPDRPDYRAMNSGMGSCNTGSGKRGTCVFGGIGCDVDHVLLAHQSGLLGASGLPKPSQNFGV